MSRLTTEIPSPIDVHVHLREPGTNEAETIESGTRAALLGGYQAVFDMPNNPGAKTHDLKCLEEKQSIAKKDSLTDIGFYAGVELVDPDIDSLLKMVKRAAGLKLYMDHTTGNTQKHGLDNAREVIDAWHYEAAKQDVYAPILLHAREEVGEETARYIASLGRHAHWCHIATASEAARAEKLTDQFGDRFTAGVTPHHLTMTDRNAGYQQGWNGARMQPPLGAEADAKALEAGFKKGTIQILETDHAPHSHEDKMKAERENPTGNTDPDCTSCYGVSGIEFVLPVMGTWLQNGRISQERLESALFYEPARMLGIKGAGKTALTAVTVLELGNFTIDESDFKGMSRNTPYMGWAAGARVIGRRNNEDSPIIPIRNALDANRRHATIFEGQSI